MQPVVKRPLTIKLVILYIMDRYRDPIPETALSTMMLGDIDVNYFDYREGLAVLERCKYIHTFLENGHEFHVLTVDGKELIDEMYKKVAYQLRMNISHYIKREKLKIKKAREFTTELVPTSDVDFNVNVTYREADDEIISITFAAGSRESANNLMNIIRARKNLFFLELNKAISNTIDAPPDNAQTNND